MDADLQEVDARGDATDAETRADPVGRHHRARAVGAELRLEHAQPAHRDIAGIPEQGWRVRRHAFTHDRLGGEIPALARLAAGMSDVRVARVGVRGAATVILGPDRGDARNTAAAGERVDWRTATRRIRAAIRRARVSKRRAAAARRAAPKRDGPEAARQYCKA